jgi:hypothetical protein
MLTTPSQAQHLQMCSRHSYRRRCWPLPTLCSNVQGAAKQPLLLYCLLNQQALCEIVQAHVAEAGALAIPQLQRHTYWQKDDTANHSSTRLQETHVCVWPTLQATATLTATATSFSNPARTADPALQQHTNLMHACCVYNTSMASHA